MAFNTGGHIITDNLVALVDAANPKSYPDPTGNVWYNLADGRVRNYINYLGVGVSGSGATQRIVFDGSSDYMQYVGCPTSLQGDPNFSVFGAFYRTSDYNSGGVWGFGTDSSLDGFGAWNSTGDNNLIAMDLWGTTTYSAGSETYPINEWVLVHWVKTAGTYANTSLTIWVNDKPYTGGDLTTLRGGAGDPTIGSNGMSLGRTGYSTNNYYAPVDIGFIAFYDKVLSGTEVINNFNAKRTRYGI